MTQLFSIPNWRSAVPTDVVSFDCDATLSTVEGIDWLAEQTGHGPAVEALTKVAMHETGVNASLYKDRLELVKPNQALIDQLIDVYYQRATPDTEQVIAAFKAAGKTICVLSAGLYQAVLGFAERLGVDQDNVGAVSLVFNEQGEYVGYDRDSLFVSMSGKATWLSEHFPEASCTHIGDGLNDVGVKAIGANFIGFGAGGFHPRVAEHCSQYITANTMAPLLSLVLTQEEVNALAPEHQELVAKGDLAISQQGVRFEATPGKGVC